MATRWYEESIQTRAPRGGFVDPLNDHFYRGGQFAPFYVPRPIMPQVDEDQYKSLQTFGAFKGVPIHRISVDARHCHAHQRVDHFHASMMPEEVRAKPILLSSDLYVLDGNHRWYAHVHTEDYQMAAYMIDKPFEEAIAFLFDFPGTYELATHAEGN